MTNAIESLDVERVMGMADAFALLSAAFVFPDENLAQAMVDGSYTEDLRAVASDAGMLAGKVERIACAVDDAAAGMDASVLLEAMRVEYSALYYAPGKFRKIYPYESVFKKREIAPNARAAAFLTRSTHDVEQAMDSYGVLPGNARREPADFFATELDFMRHLLTGLAAALAHEEDANPWLEDTKGFYGNHVLNWVPSLFEKTAELAELDLYRELAMFGLLTLGCAAGHLGLDNQ